MYQDFCKLAAEWAIEQVPYQHRGITRNGCDCTGLIIGLLRELGCRKQYKLRQYSQDWNLHAGAGDYIQQELLHVAIPVLRSSMTSGDIITFNFGRCTAHTGIYVGKNLFIHSHVKAGHCKYDQLANSPWGKRINGVWRIDDTKLELLNQWDLEAH